jgi:hypothetical protein
MGLDLMKEKGIPLDQQSFDWSDLVKAPTSKLDDDAFTHDALKIIKGETQWKTQSQ